MATREQSVALRESVAYARLDHLSHLRIRGDHAFDRLDRLTPGRLHLRDGQLLHSLLLNEMAHPLADVYLGWDDEEFFLLADGMAPGELINYLQTQLPPSDGFEIEDRTTSDAIVSLEGPYAWELLGAVLDPEAIGLPYLTFYHLDGRICYRAGKTGEYGYGVILPRSEAEAFLDLVAQEGRAFDAEQADLDTLDQGALENWFFNIRREGREAVTPIELQLQWRVSYAKDYPGAEALRQQRGVAQERLTFLVSRERVQLQDLVSCGGEPVGRVVNTGFSHIRGDYTSLALVKNQFAYPRIDFAVGDEQVSSRSVSPPVLNNRSMSVSPQLHSYSRRDAQEFPNIIRHPW